MKALIYFLIFYTGINLYAQHDYNWVFDSVLVTFDANGVVGIGTSMGSQLGIESSWSNNIGELKFYSRAWPESGLFDENHQLIPNSYNFNYSQQINGIVILPFEGTDYFSIITMDPFSDTTIIGGAAAWHHEYNITTNSLVVKNEPLIPLGSGLKTSVGATRHANGKDWWVGKKFYVSLVTSDGYMPAEVQSVGSKHGMGYKLNYPGAFTITPTNIL